MTDAALYTCIARCKSCGAELDRATGVPGEHRGQVTIAAPLAARCPVKEHNNNKPVSRGIELNVNVSLDWYVETPNGLEFLEKIEPPPEI